MPSALLSDRAGGICLSGSFALGSKITKNVPCTGQKAGAGDCSLEKHGKPKSTQFQLKLRATSGAVNQIRTGDLFLTKEVLYQLSYSSIGFVVSGELANIIIPPDRRNVKRKIRKSRQNEKRKEISKKTKDN